MYVLLAPEWSQSFDVQRLRDIATFDPSPNTNQFLISLIDIFSTTLSKHQDKIALAANARNAYNLELTIHTLKSGSRNLGALTLADLCSQIENRLRQHRSERMRSNGIEDLTLWTMLQPLLQGLEDEIVRTQETITQGLRQLRESS